MDERDVLARRFNAERGRLRAFGYRMLGSLLHGVVSVGQRPCWPAVLGIFTARVSYRRGAL
jgi:hypothetical protein